MARKSSLFAIVKEKKKKMTKRMEREETEEDVSVVPYKLHEQLQDKYILLKRKNKDNERLLAEKTSKIQNLQEANKQLSEELSTIRSLNLRLQEQLLDILKQSRDSAFKSGSREPGAKQEPAVTPEMDEDGKIKLGPGVFLTCDKWERVQESKSHSQFCKSLAVAIWGTEGLKERSVTGVKSNAVNNSVPKRPLSPQKMTVIKDCLRDRLMKLGYPKDAIEQQLSLVRRCISEKICDIRKMGQKEGKPQDKQAGAVAVAEGGAYP